MATAEAVAEERAVPPVIADRKHGLVRLARPLALYAVSRLVGAVSLITGVLLTPGGSTFRTAMGRWDGGWYLLTAERWYPPSIPAGEGAPAQTTIPFFPLFPAAIRLVSGVTGLSLFRSAALVVFVAGAALAVALWWFAERLRDGETADRTVALFVFFPGAISLTLLYSEALALLAIVLCCWALVERQWVMAGVAGAFATAARPNASSVLAAVAVAVVVALRERREWRALAAAVLAPAGLVAFVVYLKVRTGAWDALKVAQERGWGEKLSLTRPVDDIDRFVSTALRNYHETVVILGMIFAVIGLVLVLRSTLPASLKAYTAVVLAFALFTVGVRPRFALMAFPIFIVLGERLRGATFGATLGGFAAAFSSYTLLLSTGLYPVP